MCIRDRYEVVGVGMELSKACARAHASLAAARARGGKRKPVKMSAPFEVGKGTELLETSDVTNDVTNAIGAKSRKRKVALTHGKTRLEVTVETLAKLRALHGKHATPKRARGDPRRFRDDAFCVLARYAAARGGHHKACLLYTSPSPRDRTRSRMPSSA